MISLAPVPMRRLIYVRDLLRELISRDMKLRYKRSLLGVIWSLASPLAQMLALTFTFRAVLPLGIPDYPVFVFCGLLAWNWFQTSLSQATVIITNNRELIRRPGFPAAVLPAVTVSTNLTHFLLELPVLFLFLLPSATLTGAVLTLPAVIALQFMLNLSLAYLVATFNVTFRDTQHLVTLGILLLFYLTPVFYDQNAVPANYRAIYDLNPMVHLIDTYRAILLRGELPNPRVLLSLGTMSVVLLWLGHTVFVRASHRFVDEL